MFLISDWFGQTASAFLSTVAQFAAGLLLSVPIYLIKIKKSHTGVFTFIIFTIIAAVVGMILPMGTFGLIPIAVALYAKGFRIHTIVAFVLSNALFHSLILFTDPWFVWRTGILQMILAFSTAIVAGFLIWCLKIEGAVLLSNRVTEYNTPKCISDIPRCFLKSFQWAGLYLVAGVMLDTFFNRFAIWKIFELFYLNPYTAKIPQFFSSTNVENPIFLFAITIIRMLMNITTLSGLLFLFKPKGFLLYLAYYSGLAAVFVIFTMIL